MIKLRRSHEEILEFTCVAVEFISQTNLNPNIAVRAAGLFRNQRRAIAGLMQQLNGRGVASGMLSYENHAAGLMGLTSGLAAQRRLDRASISVEQWAQLIRDHLARLPTDGPSARLRRSVRSTASYLFWFQGSPVHPHEPYQVAARAERERAPFP